MQGLMMREPLLVSALLRHAERWHGAAEIVSVDAQGERTRGDWRRLAQRARRLARALLAAGVRAGDRVATLAWNDARHLELYFAVPGMGAICHTINPRLAPEQIAWIVRHAEDSLVCFDPAFRELVAGIAPLCPGVRWIELGAKAASPFEAYEDFLGAADADFEWPALDELAAASLCYTSGTTGDPKGVLYSHRSTLLHAMAIAMPDAFCLAARDCVLPVVPMFHVNAWGMPHAAAMTGAKLVLPGPRLDGASLCALLDDEGVTIAAGVPTVWQRVIDHVREAGVKPARLDRVVIGGSAAPPAMIEAFECDLGVRVLHAWGMTETSPLGAVNVPRVDPALLSPEVRAELARKQGRPPFGVDMRICDANGAPLPHDGAAQGELMLRGHWVASGYFRREDQSLREGWFATGDIASIDADGFMRITDRVKDVIKSGGEWISSIELENAAAGCPGVAEAAVIGVPHAQWGERPLLVVVAQPAARLSAEAVLAHLAGCVPKWWLPEQVVFAADLPHTATGKVSKRDLRARLDCELAEPK